ncbi:TonB-dependent receptor [Stakelama saccharophila]|uniref:TonB-dependent receptor n=1 Tax=Stakelama saccharophila TaxID=3075605 RepID=A0ABZ0B6L6_9SPHN|nr:TonB-dependent receptor [Stakelama sp. W311]WNO52893.1 TonB-dependent receptor [Stakelama sp. W311]
MKGSHTAVRTLLLASTIYAAMGVALAQTAVPAAEREDTGEQRRDQDAEAPPPTDADAATTTTGTEIVVTGIRASLENATEAKRDSIGFTDSIFAEDIGKLPATNLAETLNRIPGVRLDRDMNGEGVRVSIRGLGSDFTRVLLNGAPINVASDGGTNGGSPSRAVDLDFFPSELFTRIDVVKSARPELLEGGIAGTVNLHNARPFDNPGTHLTVVAQGQYTDSNEKISPRGALVASKTWGDTFGILAGIAGVKTQTRIDGFESIAWTDANLACPSTPGCNDGPNNGNGFSFATTAPANVGNGLTPGQPLDLSATSGLPLDRLTLAKIPRLGRNSLTDGNRERYSALLSMEFRPTETLKFAVDGLYAWSKRDYYRLNMNWYVRNSGPGTSFQSTGGMVPIDLTLDDNNVVTSGTFANSSFFLENNIFDQTTKFWNVNPNLNWQPSDMVELNVSVNYSKSDFTREQPSLLFQTSPQSGVTVEYSNPKGAVQPIITADRDLGDPDLGWQWYRANASLVKREYETKGGRFDLRWGDDTFAVQSGASYDKVDRSIRAYDNSTAFQNAICGSDCGGTGTGIIPNSELSQYLSRWGIDNFGHLADGDVGYTSIIRPDTQAIFDATDYASYRDNAPETRGAVTGGSTGDINEETWGGYLQFTGRKEVLGGDFRFTGGVRYVHTDQTVIGPSQVGDALVDITANSTYDEFLPSLNLSWSPIENLVLRAAASRTITRPDANLILPGLTFSDPSAQTASSGNPELRPYISSGYDLGGEYYTGGSGYVGFAYFRKKVDGFTVTQQQNVPFSRLNIPYETLTTTQQAALADRALNTGTDIADLPVSLNRPINLQELTLSGIEGTWVQPLDFLVEGLGFSANATHITQKSSSGLFATGIPPWQYNLQGYYENHGLSVSLNYVWTDEFVTINAPFFIGSFDQRADSRGQLDLSVNYKLPFYDKLTVTLDALNITNEPLRTTTGVDASYDNVPYSVYYPGRQILIGLRAGF